MAPATEAAQPVTATPAAAEAQPAATPPADARTALEQKMKELDNPQNQPTSAPGAVSQSPAQAGVPNSPGQNTAVIPGKSLGLKSIEAPYVPITEAQQAQLQDLLAKYKANELTPAEYHRQRVEILAHHQP